MEECGSKLRKGIFFASRAANGDGGGGYVGRTNANHVTICVFGEASHFEFARLEYPMAWIPRGCICRGTFKRHLLLSEDYARRWISEFGWIVSL